MPIASSRAEDGHATGPNEGGDDDQYDTEDDLTLQELDHADDEKDD